MVDIAVFSCFVALLIGSGLVLKAKQESSYLLADRSAGMFSLTATLVMTEFNTATLLSFASLGYLAGLRALFLPFIFLIGLSFYAVTVARKWKEYDGLSVAGFFTERYGKAVGQIAALSLFIAMVGFSAAYVKSLALVFAPLFPRLSLWTLSALVVAFVVVTALRGGLLSIIRTDVIAFCAVMLFFPLFALFAGVKGEAAVVTPNLLPPQLILSLIVLTMFTYILAPWYGQKIFAAKNPQVAVRSVAWAAGLVFCLYGCAIFVASRVGNGLENPELALPLALNFLPAGLKGLGYGIFFAASATTLTGVWSAMSTLVVGESFSAKGSAKRSMTLLVASALGSFFLANLAVDQVFDKIILANIPVAALSFALLGGFYWKGANRLGAIASICVGWAVGVGAYLTFGEERGYTLYWAIIGIPAIFISGIAFSLLKVGEVCENK